MTPAVPTIEPASPAAAAAPAASRRGARSRWILHLALLAMGAGALALLVRHVGAAALGRVLAATAPWLPVLVALEGARIAGDALATRLLFARLAMFTKRPPPSLRALARAQLAAYPVILLMPAGRVGGESLKAFTFAPSVGGVAAAVTAVLCQGLALLAGFVLSIPCAVAAFAVWGTSPLALGVAGQAVTAVAMGLAILALARRRELSGLVGRFAPRAGVGLAEVAGLAKTLPLVPLAPLAAMVLGRAAQLAQMGVLLAAVGGPRGVVPALLATGVELLGGAVGDLVPGQIGAIDGALALAAEPLGIAAAQAVAVTIALHAVQLAWALGGAALLVVVDRRGRPSR